MSDNIPFEIQVEIIKRLPVISLITSRSVSKSWKSLIDSSRFISSYSVQTQHLLVTYKHHSPRKYITIVEDDTFPHHKVSLTIPPLVNMLKYHEIIGITHGLVCLYGDYNEKGVNPLFGTGRAVIWNPSIRKTVVVEVPNVASNAYGKYGSVLGFGVCDETDSPKIVKITHINWLTNMESISCVPYQVEVFTLSTGAWRSPHSTNLPRKSIVFEQVKREQVVVDGCLYWLATDRNDGEVRSYINLIISFDITSEEFREVNLPDTLARHMYPWSLSMYKLRESLVVFESDVDDVELDITIWMMEDGASKSFTKLFTFNMPNELMVNVIGFKKTSEPILQIGQDFVTGSLVVYEPCSKLINGIGINGDNNSFYVCPYVETLLMLDHPDCIIYDNGERHISKPLSEE